MAVTNQTPLNVSTAAAGATVFAYNFKILASADLLVQVNGVTKVIGTHYTVSGVGVDAGGEVTFLAPMAGGEVVTRKREMVFQRSTDFQNLGDMRSSTLNNDQDAPVMMVQQLKDELSRALRLPVDSTSSPQLPTPQAGRALAWNASGTGLVNSDLSGPAGPAGPAGAQGPIGPSGNAANMTTSFVSAAPATSLSSTEVVVGTATVTVDTATAKVLVIATLDISKDAGVTARTLTLRLRRGTTIGGAQVGQPMVALSQAVASVPFGPQAIFAEDVPGVAGATSYVVTAAVDAGNATVNRYVLEAVQMTGAQGAQGAQGPAGSADGGTLRTDLAVTGAGKGGLLIAYLSGTVSSFLDALQTAGAAVGAALVKFLPAGTGAATRTVQEKLRDSVHIADFGATGNTAQDATAAFNAAIAALPASGGTIYVDPAGTYQITAPVIYTKPVLWKCIRGLSDITTNTNGGDAEKPLIYFNGASGNTGAILTQKPAAAGTCLYGGGSDGIFYDGQALIATALHLDCNRYGIVNGKARNCTSEGLLISSMTGTTGIFSKKVRVQDWDYIYGVSVACANSHGIRIKGNGTTVPSTQIHVDRVFALIKHGSAIRIEETDNCQIGSAQAVGDSGAGGGGGAATGCTAWLAAAGSTVSYNNHFDYIVGELRHENGAFGTTFNHMTYEGSLIKQVAGTPSWHGKIVDFSGVNGAAKSDRFTSHEYPLRKVHDIPVGSMHGLSFGLFAGTWSAGVLPESGNATATAIIPIDADMSTGNIEGVTVLIGSNTAGAGNYRLTLQVSCANLLDAGPTVTPQRVVAETVAAAAQYQVKEHAFTFADLAFVKGQFVLLNLNRIPADALDTATTDLYLLGVRIKYRSSGPTTATAMTAANMPTWNMP